MLRVSGSSGSDFLISWFSFSTRALISLVAEVFEFWIACTFLFSSFSCCGRAAPLYQPLYASIFSLLLLTTCSFSEIWLYTFVNSGNKFTIDDQFDCTRTTFSLLWFCSSQYKSFIYYKNKSMLFLPLLLLVSVLSKPIPPRNIIVAIDCGTLVELKTSLGVQFSKDQGYSENTTTLHHRSGELEKVDQPLVKYTPDKGIYLSERTSKDSFSYVLPLPGSPQRYVLILKFAEVTIHPNNGFEFTVHFEGLRKFNVLLGDRKVISDLDVHALAGFGAAHDEYIEFEYRDRKVYQKNEECQSAVNENGELTLTFEKGLIGDPFISAIVLVKGTLEDTDYLDRQEAIQEWNRRYPNKTKAELRKEMESKKEERKAKIDKKKSTLKIREGHESEIGLHPKAEDVVPSKRKLRWLSWEELKYAIMNPFGIVLIIGFLMSSFVIVTETLFKSEEKIKRQKMIIEYYEKKKQQERSRQGQETTSSSDSTPRKMAQGGAQKRLPREVLMESAERKQGKVSPMKRSPVKKD